MRLAPIRSVPLTPPPRSRTLGAVLIASSTLLAVVPAGASAGGLQRASPVGTAARAARIHLGGMPTATTVLPADSGRPSATASSASSGTWLIGVGTDHARAAALAARSGGTYDETLGVLTVPRGRADAIARSLGSAVAWAGPNLTATPLSSFDQPAGVQSPWARSVGGAPSLTPDPRSLAPIGIVDDAVDGSVAELQGVDVVNGATPVEPHGTMVASTAAAPYDGIGVVGVAPGAKVYSWGTTLTCGDVSRGITTLVRKGAKVVNVSLGFNQSCFALWQATSYAYANGVTMVAASGNDGDRGNPLSYPASYPHVITATAVDQNLAFAVFSNHNDYVDLAAPGVDVPVDMPLRFDIEDGVVDGQSQVSGTSFASPYVAGGLSWILGARPGLDPGQAAALLRLSSRDLGTPGWDRFTGFGLLQINAALSLPTPAADALEPNDDPAFVKTAGQGTFAKPLIWRGGQRTRIIALGDSADDPVDAYRIKVPGKSKVTIRVRTSVGSVDLFAFDQDVTSFSGEPVDASTRSGRAIEEITLRNDDVQNRIAYVVVNSVPDGGTRTRSRYAVSVQRT